jgi:pilus assembly protein CpaB
MKTRGLAVAVAFLLAIGATGAVYLYVSGVRKDAKTEVTDMATVIVSKQDIPAQTELDNLISSGAFTTLQVPVAAVVHGAVTDVSQLKGQSTAFPILEGEQITTARLQGSSTQVEGGVLGIPAGHKAVTLPVDIPRAVGGVLQTGDHITLYATFEDATVVNTDLEKLFEGESQEAPTKQEIGDFTMTVVADIEVLKVGLPTDQNSGSPALLTLSLTPEEAQRVVFAQEEGKIWVGLLPPGETGTAVPPLSVFQELQ